MTTFKLAKEYLWLGIITIICSILSLYWQPNVFSSILASVIVFYALRTPYRIDLFHDDSLRVHRITGKEIIPLASITAVERGSLRDCIRHKGGYVPLNPLLSDVNQLTREIIGYINIADVKPAPEHESPQSYNTPNIIIAFILIFLLAILFPVLVFLSFFL